MNRRDSIQNSISCHFLHGIYVFALSLHHDIVGAFETTNKLVPNSLKMCSRLLMSFTQYHSDAFTYFISKLEDSI